MTVFYGALDKIQ